MLPIKNYVLCNIFKYFLNSIRVFAKKYFKNCLVLKHSIKTKKSVIKRNANIP